MFNQAAVMLAEERKRVADEMVDVSLASTGELPDYVDANDLFTPMALKVFLAKGQNGNGNTKIDPALVDP